MQAKRVKMIVGGALLGAVTFPAFAADIYEPPVIEAAPPPVVYEQPEADFGGWYIRGDLGYQARNWRGAQYITYGPPPGSNVFTGGDLDNSWTGGIGIGYQISKHLRTDLTLDWLGKSDFRGTTTGTCGLPPVPCASVDTSSYSAILMLANAYVDLGTWHGITPYVGAGIGGAHVKWDDLTNTVGGITTTHRGTKQMRFAGALMVGASYCLTDRLALDAGYRFTHIQGGQMFQYANGGGPGFDRALNVHEGRAGLRYQFGGKSGCSKPERIAYEPEPLDPPIYK